MCKNVLNFTDMQGQIHVCVESEKKKKYSFKLNFILGGNPPIVSLSLYFMKGYFWCINKSFKKCEKIIWGVARLAVGEEENDSPLKLLEHQLVVGQ